MKVLLARPHSVPAAASSLLVLATTILYLATITSQGNSEPRRSAAVVVILLISAALGIIGSSSGPATSRSVVLAIAAGSLLGMGWLAIFSIGLLLLVSGGLFALAAVKATAEARAGFAALPLIAGGLSLVAAPLTLLWLA